VLLSEKRKIKREKAKKREVKSFVEKVKIPAIPSHEIFLWRRAGYLYCARRLGILKQHEGANLVEIEWLEKIQAEILRDFPQVTDGLRPEDLCPTRLEI
jgi:hypothetical protein